MIAEKIKKLRLNENLTQKQLAEKIQSTSKNIWAYENEIATPPADILLRLANFFDVSVDYLLGREDDFCCVKKQDVSRCFMFADRIKKLRKEHNLTQVEFAKIFNISNGTIAMWETAKRQPDFETLLKIADYFNVSTDYFFGRENNLRQDILSEEDKEILNQLHALSCSDLKSIKIQIKALADANKDDLLKGHEK